MTFARAMPGEYRGMYLKPRPEIAERPQYLSPVLTREALEVAEEYVLHRRAEGWTPGLIVQDLGIEADPSWAWCIRIVAEHWQEIVAPASRAADAERRSAFKGISHA